MFRLLSPVLFAALLILPALGNPSTASAISIEEAYKSIPQQQTTYEKGKSKLPKETSEVFEDFFHIIDLAIVCRVEAVQILRMSRGKVEKQITDLKRFAHRIREYKLPDESAEVARLIGNAMMDEVNYLKAIARGDRMQIQQYANDLRIQSASEKLKQAEQALLKAYPKESEHNRQAFRDHLAALDFL